MSTQPYLEKASIQALPRARDRMSFLYLERCLISRQDGALSVTDGRGTVCVPAASLSVLMLGPGTNLSHRAMELIGDAGATVLWVGERGVRYYAHGKPLTHSARLLIKQAELVSNTRSRIAVARRMYAMRFPGEDVAKMTMQQLRGREGARVRTIYRRESKATGVPWDGREYNPDDFSSGSDVNKALSAGHACLYGICHSVIVALGCSAGLGFVHTGHERSFVYDIADLYKAEITIPLAFQLAAEAQTLEAKEGKDDIGALMRRRVRDAVSNGHILERAVRDIKALLIDNALEGEEGGVGEEDELGDLLHLWDEKFGTVAAGTSYRGHDTWDELSENLDADLADEGYGRILQNEQSW